MKKSRTGAVGLFIYLFRGHQKNLLLFFNRKKSGSRRDIFRKRENWPQAEILLILGSHPSLIYTYISDLF